MSISSIPSLDLSLLKGTQIQRESFYKDLRYAAREIGFFYSYTTSPLKYKLI